MDTYCSDHFTNLPPAVGLNVQLYMDRNVISAQIFYESGSAEMAPSLGACCQILAFKSFSTYQIIKNMTFRPK
jgi:hypothetical protein